MARVTYGALITELAGSIGGITFQKNASGNIARLRPHMSVNASDLQRSQQGLLNSLVSGWSALTLAQQTGWNNFAAAHSHVNEFGETKILNGFQWFLSCNLNLSLIGEATITAAPAWTVMVPADPFTLINTAPHLELNWAVPMSYPSGKAVFYFSPPIKQSSLKLRKFYLVGLVMELDATETINIESYLLDLFNITWATFRGSSEAILSVRVKLVEYGTGLASIYTTGQIKIG